MRLGWITMPGKTNPSNHAWEEYFAAARQLSHCLSHFDKNFISNSCATRSC